ncbi:hypothetical protein CPBF367_04860 [Xanthomonas arboricola pv. juglandis]|nr:hypothetical protein CPBF367_04860 [Xanthomonas arboricola pv. juglandis]
MRLLIPAPIPACLVDAPGAGVDRDHAWHIFARACPRLPERIIPHIGLGLASPVHSGPGGAPALQRRHRQHGRCQARLDAADSLSADDPLSRALDARLRPGRYPSTSLPPFARAHKKHESDLEGCAELTDEPRQARSAQQMPMRPGSGRLAKCVVCGCSAAPPDAAQHAEHGPPARPQQIAHAYRRCVRIQLVRSHPSRLDACGGHGAYPGPVAAGGCG